MGRSPAVTDVHRSIDADALARLEGAKKGDAARLDLLPQPWTGRPSDATVIVLALNQGFTPDDYQELPELRGSGYIRLSNHQNPYFSRAQMAPEAFAGIVSALTG